MKKNKKQNNIMQTGHKLEEETREILIKNGWDVGPNLYYTDPITGKPREKDIIATLSQMGDNGVIKYQARLFIECKNLPKATKIYLTDEKIEHTILDQKIDYAKIAELERNKKFHFYKYSQIFAAKDSKDFLYKAINQNLASFNAFRKNNLESGVYFLTVVFKGKIQYEDQYNNLNSLNRALIKIGAMDNTFNLPNKQCIIELVSIDQLEDYLKDITEDISEINKSARFYYQMEKSKIDERRKRIIEEKKADYGL